MDSSDSGEGAVAAVVNTAIFSNYLKGGVSTIWKDYYIFKQSYAQPNWKKDYLQYYKLCTLTFLTLC
jgi:hypothetical protein